MFFLLTLPFRIVFGILGAILFLPIALVALPFAVLLLPFLLLRLVIKTAIFMLVLPFVLLAVLLAGGVAIVAVLCAMLAPLLPFIALGLVVWAVIRLSHPAYVR